MPCSALGTPVPERLADVNRPDPNESLDVPPVTTMPPVGEVAAPGRTGNETADHGEDSPPYDSAVESEGDGQGHLRAERTDEHKESEEDEKGYADLRRVHQRVYNTFYGTVAAQGAVFGLGTASPPGLAPGVVPTEAVDEALRFYVCPQPCFDAALDRLRSDALVVLTGHEDCGRGAGALALLRRVAGDDVRLRSLSPANALADLAATSAIKEGQAYVIRDYVGETNVEAVQAYHIGRLSEELLHKGAYLVITADHTSLRRLALKDHCVQWHAPDAVQVFQHCREQLPQVEFDAENEAELLERVAAQRRPADVVAAALALSESPGTALETLRDGDTKTVQEWFRAQPCADDLLPLAALAFLEGVPERTFEKACALLLSHVRNWELNGETPVGDPEAVTVLPARGSSFEQSRARWKERAVGLVHMERRPEPGQDGCRGERRLVFVSPRIRDLVIGELHTLYGYELWYPMRRWLDDLSRFDDLDARMEVARGTAMLAGYALVEVENHLLETWAEGITSQRVTAALTLQFMCEVEHLAPQALQLVIRWADNSGQGRAITTAMAMTGTLGSLYRLEALNWCWFLIGRGERIAFAARRSMVLLLQSAEQEPERALLTLRYVRNLIASSTQRSKDRLDALRTAVQLLEADRLEGSGSVASALLCHTADSAHHLGALWTEVLLSTFRRRAVRALCRTLVHLRDDPDATVAVRRLGEAMRDRTSDRQWSALAHALSSALRDPDFATPGTHQLARVLIGSLRGPSRTDHVRSASPPPSPKVSSSVLGGRSK
ncbi:hypothetical protein [Streptomyces sp. NPDC017941]|uniref:hypothetical protein n=1 Tax=Streptomyces sp. NPDC017941 TaxID=3365018 RepID=UPI00378AC249